MSTESKKDELTKEQEKEVVRVANNLCRIVSYEVMNGDKDTERNRFARTFLLEAMQRTNVI